MFLKHAVLWQARDPERTELATAGPAQPAHRVAMLDTLTTDGTDFLYTSMVTLSSGVSSALACTAWTGCKTNAAAAAAARPLLKSCNRLGCRVSSRCLATAGAATSLARVLWHVLEGAAKERSSSSSTCTVSLVLIGSLLHLRTLGSRWLTSQSPGAGAEASRVEGSHDCRVTRSSKECRRAIVAGCKVSSEWSIRGNTVGETREWCGRKLSLNRQP